MRRVTTRVPFHEYCKLMEGKEVIGMSESLWYALLKPALEELKNEYLAEFVVNIDFFVIQQQFRNKKFNGTQVLFMQEYIKRVRRFDERLKKQEQEYVEAEKKAREKLQELRLQMQKENEELWKSSNPAQNTMISFRDTIDHMNDYHLHDFRMSLRHRIAEGMSGISGATPQECADLLAQLNEVVAEIDRRHKAKTNPLQADPWRNKYIPVVGTPGSQTGRITGRSYSAKAYDDMIDNFRYNFGTQFGAGSRINYPGVIDPVPDPSTPIDIKDIIGSIARNSVKNALSAFTDQQKLAMKQEILAARKGDVKKLLLKCGYDDEQAELVIAELLKFNKP